MSHSPGEPVAAHGEHSRGMGKQPLRLRVVSAIPVRGEGKMPALGNRIVLDLMSSPKSPTRTSFQDKAPH